MVKKIWVRVFLPQLTSCLILHRLFNQNEPQSTHNASALLTTRKSCLKIKQKNGREHDAKAKENFIAKKFKAQGELINQFFKLYSCVSEK